MTGTSNISNNPFAYQAVWEDPSLKYATPPSQITIPLVPAEQQPIVQSIDNTGNVPMVQNLPKEENTGISIEKENKPFIKTGESLDERLDRYYAGKYSKATVEEKKALLERYITGHFKTLKGKTPEQITQIQLADYKKLLSNTQNPDDYQILAEKIYVLENPNQIPAAKASTADAPTKELKTRAEIGLANTAHKFAKENQIEVVTIIAESDNHQAQVIGAGHASEFAVENQNKVHEAYFNINNEEVQTVLTEQLGKYDKSVQIPIFERTMTSEYQCVLEQAASNIHTLDKDNQVQATQITLDTGNEDAIRAAYSNRDLCAKENQEKLNDMYCSAIANYGYDLESENASQSTPTTTATETKEFDKQATETKIKQISEAKGKEKTDKIKQMMTTASRAELEALISRLNPGELFNVAYILLDFDLPADIMNKILARVSELDPKEQKAIWEKIKRGNISSAPSLNFYTMDSNLQIFELINAKSNGNLFAINKDKLSQNSKDFYEKLVSEKKKENLG